MPNTAGATIRKLPIRSARMSSAICRLERHAATRATDSAGRSETRRVPPAASQPLITKYSRLWAVTKYSYRYFSSRNSRFLRDLFRVAHSRCCVNFLASSRSHPLNETLRRARIPDRDLGARLRRPPWVRSFCRRASSRACGSRYAPPWGSPRASFPSASAHPFPLSSFPPDQATPRPTRSFAMRPSPRKRAMTTARTSRL